MAKVIMREQEEARVVMDYMPKKISMPVSREAEKFVLNQPTAENAVSFRMSDLVAQQTGIQELEKASIEKRIEQKALERLKEIQEQAYQEAYDLGLLEGTKKGHEDSKALVTERLQQFSGLLEKLTHIKTDMLLRNEVQLVDFVYYMASRIAMREIEKDAQRIIPVLKHAIEALQKDESMVIKISPEDLAQVEELKKISGQEFEFLNKAKFETNPSIKPGGCIVETNYGLIDATVEERVEKLMTTLEESKPSTKGDSFE